MKNIRRIVLQSSILSLMYGSTIISVNNVAPTLDFRSAARDTVGKVVGTTSHHVHLFDMESYYGTMFIRPKFQQSFRSSNISDCLFGNALVNTDTITTSSDSDDDNNNNGRRSIVITGSQVASRGANDLMAENFLLARDFKGVISFKPQVRTFLMDFHFYIALDEWIEGMYFRIYGPLVHSRYDLNFRETPGTSGTVGYGAGYFDTVAVPQSSLLQSFAAYGQGNTISSYSGSTVTVQPLQFAKITSDDHRKTCFGELRAEFGYNFLLDEDYHLGIAIEAAAPTGKRNDAEYLFAPECGSHHWELGAGITGHYTLWRSEDEEKHFDFVLEADITHLFKSKEKRTFDLKGIGKGLSRYMLAEQMTSPAVNLTAGTDATTAVAPSAQFNRVFAPVANISTRDVKVSIGVQADIVAMFNFTCRGFSWDLGYNYWGRSKEKISLREDDDSNFPTNWALKGDASVFGYVSGNATGIALSATESNATLNAGTNLSSVNNSGVNNATLAFDNSTPTKNPLLTSSTGTTAINTSSTPIFIQLSDLNVEGSETKGMSNKIFTHFNYTWVDREDWVPYVGIGAEVEFGRHSGNNSDDNNSSDIDDASSLTCALSQWGIWIKGGLSFN